MKNSSHQMMKLTFFPSKSDTRDCSFFFPQGHWIKVISYLSNQISPSADYFNDHLVIFPMSFC